VVLQRPVEPERANRRIVRTIRAPKRGSAVFSCGLSEFGTVRPRAQPANLG
jgi:hypothetical protein